MAKTAFLELLKSPKIDFTQNLNDRKILKFLHCVDLTSAQSGKTRNVFSLNKYFVKSTIL